MLALDNRLQPTTLTRLARGQIGGPGWLAGERVKVRIEHSFDGLTLPEGALVQEGTQSFVFRVEAENKVSRQTVRVLARSSGQVVIGELTRATQSSPRAQLSSPPARRSLYWAKTRASR